MSYEDAPATKMLATHCACCNRPLCDALSVELGIGPECRKRHGYSRRCPDEIRTQANVLVHRIACRPGFTELAAALTELHMLGFTKLAEIITKRNATVHVEILAGARMLVKTPFTEGSLEVIRTIPGRRVEYMTVDGKKKFIGNSFPAEQKPRVWRMIKQHFPGAMGVGPKGTFSVPEGGGQVEDARTSKATDDIACRYADEDGHDPEDCRLCEAGV